MMDPARAITAAITNKTTRKYIKSMMVPTTSQLSTSEGEKKILYAVITETFNSYPSTHIITTYS